MKIVVWSSLTGDMSGYDSLKVDKSMTADEIIDIYCNNRGLKRNSKWLLQTKYGSLIESLKTLAEANVEDGHALCIIPERSTDGTFRFSKWYLLSLMFIILGLITSLLLLFKAGNIFQLTNQNERFGIVIDAGSSHSSFYVFKWLKSDDVTVSPYSLELLHQCKQEGSISSLMKSSSEDINTYLSVCINELKVRVPTERSTGTPLYLAATAGMRIVRDFDPHGATKLLDRLLTTLTKVTPFDVKESHVSIVSGEIEGASGWLAANYLMGNLGQSNNSSELRTMATLDAGGASVQLTHRSDEPQLNLSVMHEQYQLYSQTFMCVGVFESRARQRYLLLEDSHGAYFEEDLDRVDIVGDPCYPTGAKASVSQYELLMPCTLSALGKKKLKKYFKNKKRKLGKVLVNHEIKETNMERQKMLEETGAVVVQEFTTHSDTITALTEDKLKPHYDTRHLLNNYQHLVNKYNFTNGLSFLAVSEVANNVLNEVLDFTAREHKLRLGSKSRMINRLKRKYHLVGTSDGEKCLQKVKELFESKICNNTFRYGTCLSKKDIPTFPQDLLAFSDMFVLVARVLDIENTKTLANLRLNVLKLCSMNYTELHLHYILKAADIMLDSSDELCFQSVYLYSLITHGLGYDELNWGRVHFQRTIHNASVEWTLGYLLDRIYNPAPSLPTNLPNNNLHNKVAMLLLVMLVFCFIFAAVCTFVLWRRLRGKSNIYDRLYSKHLNRTLKL